MARPEAPDPAAPIVVLGAGYAGLTAAEEIRRRTRDAIPIHLIDRHPVHVLRTELYEIGEIAGAGADVNRWLVPLVGVFDRTSVRIETGTVDRIDVAQGQVRLDGRARPYRTLVIALGNVAAYYGVPGAREHCRSIYRLSEAQRTAAALRELEGRSSSLPREVRPRIVVIGGGSTGTELASEVATTDWAALVGHSVRTPDVVLITGALPFLDGFPRSVIDRADRTLRRQGVSIVRGINVAEVEEHRVRLTDGTVLASDLSAWCAGLEAPAVVRELPVPHGPGGRIVVEPTLELAGWPGVFAVGDVAAIRNAGTGALVPATAQAAISEGPVVARNVIARLEGRPLAPYRYRERGVIVALGSRRGAGTIGPVSLWGRPAKIVKRLVEREYLRSAKRGRPPRLA